MNPILKQLIDDPLVLLMSGAILGYVYAHFLE